MAGCSSRAYCWVNCISAPNPTSARNPFAAGIRTAICLGPDEQQRLLQAGSSVAPGEHRFLKDRAHSAWRCTPVIPALGKQRQEDCSFKPSWATSKLKASLTCTDREGTKQTDLSLKPMLKVLGQPLVGLNFSLYSAGTIMLALYSGRSGERQKGLGASHAMCLGKQQHTVAWNWTNLKLHSKGTENVTR